MKHLYIVSVTRYESISTPVAPHVIVEQSVSRRRRAVVGEAGIATVESAMIGLTPEQKAAVRENVVIRSFVERRAVFASGAGSTFTGDSGVTVCIGPVTEVL